MITLRAHQFEQLKEARLERLVLAMARYLAPTPAKSPPELETHVREHLGKALGYGFASEQDIHGYFGLIKRYGWNFEHVPAHRWMADALGDTDFTSASERLQHLIARCDQREAIAASNAAIAREHGLATPFSRQGPDAGNDHTGSH